MSKPTPQPIEPSLVARISQGLRYIATGNAPDDWFGPGLPEPAPQAPPEIAGRAFDFPAGYNTGTQLRAYEAIGFPELRALAESWDLLRLVIETRKDQLEKLDWSIQPRAASPARQTMAAGPDPRIEAVESFLRMPDREHAWGTWLRLLLEDLFVIDAPTLYLRRDRIGRLYALEVVDGATIKRILDDSGRTPAPPSPAYRQILKGVPAVDYTSDELVYMPRNPRPHKVYGYSPVEQIVLTVNIALRRALSQLQYYTEGNVPEALIGVPASWSPDQIRQFQLYWDSLMEGNIAARRHARFIPGDMKYQPTRDPVLKDQYDEWLARIACYAFSVAPTPFISQVNRATAESAQDAALAEGLAPLQNWVKRLVDLILARELGVPDLEFAWAQGRELDPAAQAGIDQIYVQSGVKSIDEVRATLGLVPIGYGNAVMGLEPYPVGPGPNTGSPSDVGKAQTPALKYGPDQPRVPSGDPAGGQWTSGGDSAEGDSDAADGSSSDLSSNDHSVALTDAVDRPGEDTQVALETAANTPALTQSAIAAGVSPTPPEYKNQIVPQSAWVGFNNAVAALPAVTPGEQFAYSEIFAAEGGVAPDTSDGSTPSSSGIMASAIATYIPSAVGIAPIDLTDAQRAEFYQAYFNVNLTAAGGAQALNQIGDQNTAAAVADTVFQNGAQGIGAIQNAVNAVLTSSAQGNQATGNASSIAVDNVFGPQTFNAIKAIVASNRGQALRNAIAAVRASLPGATTSRIANFQFTGDQE